MPPEVAGLTYWEVRGEILKIVKADTYFIINLNAKVFLSFESYTVSQFLTYFYLRLNLEVLSLILLDSLE